MGVSAWAKGACMSSEAAAAFADRLMNDESFAKSLAEAETAEDRLTLARAAGFDVSANDVGAVKGALGISELADDDLERVTGGSAITLVDNTSSDVPFIIFQSEESL